MILSTILLVTIAISEQKTFNCEYAKDKPICKIENQDVPFNTTEIKFAVPEYVNRTLGIWFEKSKLEFVPTEIFDEFRGLQLLKISGSEIPVLKKDYLKGMSPLLALELTRDGIVTIEVGAFQELRNLKQISLYSNALKTLPAKIFQNNLKLEVIDLNENKIETVDQNLLNGLEKLHEISFYSNQLEEIPDNLFEENKLLSKIFLNNNHLKRIDEETFAGLTNLTEVYLSTNHLEFIPPNLFKDNKKINAIFLNNNKLKKIDQEVFLGLPGLYKLSLASNELESLPIKIFHDNEKLDFIYLNNNKIKSLTPILFQSNANRLRSFVDLTDNECIDKKFDVFEMIGQQLKDSLANCKNNSCNLDSDARYFKTVVLSDIVDSIKVCTEKCYEDEDCLGELVKERNEDVIFTIFHQLNNNEKTLKKFQESVEDKLTGLQTLDETKNKTVNTLLKEQKDRTEDLDVKFITVACIQALVILLLLLVIIALALMFRRLKKQNTQVEPDDSMKKNLPDSTNI